MKGPSALDVAAKVLSTAMRLRDYPRAETVAALRLLRQSNPAIVAWLREVLGQAEGTP
jgi:hypothetical protein